MGQLEKLKLAIQSLLHPLTDSIIKMVKKLEIPGTYPTDLRKKIIFRVKQICDSFSFTFSSCREGFPELNTSSSCDASHLIR